MDFQKNSKRPYWDTQGPGGNLFTKKSDRGTVPLTFRKCAILLFRFVACCVVKKWYDVKSAVFVAQELLFHWCCGTGRSSRYGICLFNAALLKTPHPRRTTTGYWPPPPPPLCKHRPSTGVNYSYKHNAALTQWTLFQALLWDAPFVYECRVAGTTRHGTSDSTWCAICLLMPRCRNNSAWNQRFYEVSHLFSNAALQEQLGVETAVLRGAPWPVAGSTRRGTSGSTWCAICLLMPRCRNILA
jgi:hypothetical protein